ncbi:MAG: siderophore-interacting protein [Dehalococcoidia bacterium]
MESANAGPIFQQFQAKRNNHMKQQQAPRQRPRPTYRTVQVKHVDRVTPHALRVTFTGDELEGFATRGPAEHIRLFFPFPGEERPVMPVWGPNGPEMPPGQQRPVSRVYTPRRWNPTPRELEVEFVLHGDGPGSTWAEQAAPGATVVVAGPGGPYQIHPESRSFLIAGDHAALPAIVTILDVLPAAARADVYVEVEGAAEEQALASRAQVDVTWLHGAGADPPGRRLEAAIRSAPLPEGSGRIFVACEATIMRDIRRHLLYERGLERGAVYTHGYWKQGEVNHPDHDLGDDI